MLMPLLFVKKSAYCRPGNPCFAHKNLVYFQKNEQHLNICDLNMLHTGLSQMLLSMLTEKTGIVCQKTGSALGCACKKKGSLEIFLLTGKSYGFPGLQLYNQIKQS